MQLRPAIHFSEAAHTTQCYGMAKAGLALKRFLYFFSVPLVSEQVLKGADVRVRLLRVPLVAVPLSYRRCRCAGSLHCQEPWLLGHRWSLGVWRHHFQL